MNSVIRQALLLSFLAVCLNCAGPAVHVKTGQHPARMDKEITIKVTSNYLLHIPKKYEETTEPWPLLLFLHGAQERHDNKLELLKEYGPVKAAYEQEDFPFILVSPQCPEDQWWASDRQITVLDALLDEIIATYRVDTNRIYVTGLSMGGYGTWELAMRYPNRFAAIAPICGGGNLERVCEIKHLPIWGFHGLEDNVVPFSNTALLVDALENCGANVQFTAYPGVGHTSWVPAYRTERLYSWMLSHTKSPDGTMTKSSEQEAEFLRNIVFSLDTVPAHADTLKELSTTLHIMNSSAMTANLDGMIYVPNGEYQDSVTVIDTIEPGETRSIPVVLRSSRAMAADMFPDGHFIWKATAIGAWDDTLRMSGYTNLLPATPYAIGNASKPIEIDGDLSDWKSPSLVVNEPAQIQHDPQTYQGSKDCRFRFSVVKDEKFLYVAVQVADDVHNVDSAKHVWQQDGIELRIDARAPNERAVSAKDWEDVLPIAVSPWEDPLKPTIWKPEKLPENTGIACARTRNGYCLEVAVPLAYIVTKQGSRWESIRINVAVNDFDHQKNGARLWWKNDWRGDHGIDAGTFLRQ